MVAYLRICVVIWAGLATGACAAALEGYPDRVSDPNQELESLKVFTTKMLLDEYSRDSTPTERKKSIRDDYVNAKLRSTDIKFGQFQQRLFKEGVGSGILTTWLELGLGGAGAVFSGPSQALSAASTGIVGAKAAFDKEAFFENTLPTLLAAMDANRKTVKARIRLGLASSVSAYPLTQALSDLEDYYNAGTIPGALLSINEDSGAKGKEADAKIAETLSSKFLKDTAGNKLRTFWKPDGTNINDDNQTAIRNWMRENNVDTLSLTFFLRSELFADARAKAVKDLGLE